MKNIYTTKRNDGVLNHMRKEEELWVNHSEYPVPFPIHIVDKNINLLPLAKPSTNNFFLYSSEKYSPAQWYGRFEHIEESDVRNM